MSKDRKEIAESLARASINASNYITSFFKETPKQKEERKLNAEIAEIERKQRSQARLAEHYKNFGEKQRHMDYNRENKKGTFSVEADKKWDDQVNTPSSRKSVSHLSSAQRLGDKRNKSVSSLTKSEKRGTRGGKGTRGKGTRGTRGTRGRGKGKGTRKARR